MGQLDCLTKLFFCFIQLLMRIKVIGQRKDRRQGGRELQLQERQRLADVYLMGIDAFICAQSFIRMIS